MTFLGIYKELDNDEKLIQESSDICEVHSKSGISFVGWLLKEKPDTSFAKVYLTNTRLLFLSFYTGKLAELKEGKSNVTGLAINWVEVPLDAIVKIETPAKLGFTDFLSSMWTKKESKDKRAELVLYLKSIRQQKKQRGLWRELILLPDEKEKKMSIVIDNRDSWAISIDNASHKYKKSTKTGPQVDDSYRVACEICGSHYNEDDVKMVKCDNCGRWVCREKKEGLIRKEWINTGCFDKKTFLCKACKVKGH
jgi:hypothetical protein